jgi:hypothetical protein
MHERNYKYSHKLLAKLEGKRAPEEQDADGKIH